MLEYSPNLKYLNISFLELQNFKIFHQELQELILDSTTIQDEQVESILKETPNLNKLSLSLCKNLSTPCFNHQKLLELNLKRTKITNLKIEHVPKLKNLNVCSCPNLTYLEDFQLFDLEILNISNTELCNFTFSTRFPNLKTLFNKQEKYGIYCFFPESRFT